MTRHKWCNVSAAVFSILVAGPFFWLLFDRAPPFERNAGWIEPANPKPGDEVRVIWEAKFIRDCPGFILRTVTDSAGDIWTPPASFARYANRRVPRQVLATFQLDPKMACGPATYVADARYVCNWTQTVWPIRVDKPVIKFNVAC